MRCIIHLPRSIRRRDEFELLTNCCDAYSDAFQKREKAQEDYAIRQREKEKLLDLKKRLEKSNDHIKQLEKDM